VAFFGLSGSWLSLYLWSALAEDAEVNAAGEGFLENWLASKMSIDAEQATESSRYLLS